jgi:hypothetical protein
MNQPVKIAARRQRGQSSMEYIVVCGALVLALGIGMSNDQSVLRELLEAFRTPYHNFSYSISLPG